MRVHSSLKIREIHHEFDAVAELVERESAVGKTAVCGLNTGSISPMFSCIETEFEIRQQHLNRGNAMHIHEE